MTRRPLSMIRWPMSVTRRSPEGVYLLQNANTFMIKKICALYEEEEKKEILKVDHSFLESAIFNIIVTKRTLKTVRYVK